MHLSELLKKVGLLSIDEVSHVVNYTVYWVSKGVVGGWYVQEVDDECNNRLSGYFRDNKELSVICCAVRVSNIAGTSNVASVLYPLVAIEQGMPTVIAEYAEANNGVMLLGETIAQTGAYLVNSKPTDNNIDSAIKAKGYLWLDLAKIKAGSHEL